MTKGRLRTYVKEEFGVSLEKFIREKVEKESLYDYEIASILDVNTSSICKLRRAYGIRKADAFSRRFELKYGEGAVETFKEMIENPDNSLTDVARHFDFSREYARQAYKKIYGTPYTKTYQKKRLARQRKILTERRQKSLQIGNLMKVIEKMNSMGLDYRLRNSGRRYTIFTNGYKVALRSTSTPVSVGRKKYFRINNTGRKNMDFDFYICLCRNKKEDTHFVIPSHAMPRSVVSLRLDATSEESKYAQFKEAWHLLPHKN